MKTAQTILMILAEHHRRSTPISMARLCALVGADMHTLSDLLKRMDAEGLIVRSGASVRATLFGFAAGTQLLATRSCERRSTDRTQPVERRASRRMSRAA